MAKKRSSKSAQRHPRKTYLIPVVSDLEALSRCAARTLCEMAHRRNPNLAELTLGELRTALENELVELDEALEEIDLLIEEQGSDAKAIQLDLEPAQEFARIREKCLQMIKADS